ncbi:MAG: hypothetical protein DYG83_01170 [Candidatus Brocadia sp. AMX2]|uniref:Uncharacterized protein n=1 Tax=Candidatus Brocadia sinica JPN1 TaxID=1197129 RepID=A0ABQ0JVK3_9BACT|nr:MULTISPECIES: hypothetical protein [Brocadia]MBC6930759.1 hypothetical protein [Candidatus Brocadia sp.]NOG41341.1 hypothetical protein [Planctomycetota bacterium]GIK13665.1 MAG: hypothetical protein BroJett002_23720 [Candidatus Brocadia sinica]KAA0245599.1 MAG: hypothetical protein EDM70_01565 [Candidatus Brocadia sp. AMX2]MCE7865434.1 hypothetical protein [Candidatus Brocadia sp. AMX2]
MKLRLFPSIVIFLSSYSPLALILIVKDFDLNSYPFKHPYFAFGVLIIAILSVVALFFVIKNIKSGFHIKIEKISNCSNELINYTIPYIVSFLGLDLSRLHDIAAFSIFMILLCLLTIKTQSLFINPILAVWGYGLYDIQFTENNVLKNGIFLSKHDLSIGKSYRIQKLSKFMYIITGIIEEGQNE